MALLPQSFISRKVKGIQMTAASSYPHVIQAILRVAEHVAKVDDSSCITPWHTYLACVVLDQWFRQPTKQSEGTTAQELWIDWENPLADCDLKKTDAFTTQIIENSGITVPNMEVVTDLLNREDPHSLPLSKGAQNLLNDSLLLLRVLKLGEPEFSTSHTIFLGALVNDANDERVINSLLSLGTDVEEMVSEYLRSLIKHKNAKDIERCGSILIEALRNAGYEFLRGVPRGRSSHIVAHKFLPDRNAIRSIVAAFMNQERGANFCDAILGTLTFGLSIGEKRNSAVRFQGNYLRRYNPDPSDKGYRILSVALVVAILRHWTSEDLTTKVLQNEGNKAPSKVTRVALAAILSTLPLLGGEE